jgi:hypothetical protein
MATLATALKSSEKATSLTRQLLVLAPQNGIPRQTTMLGPLLKNSTTFALIGTSATVSLRFRMTCGPARSTRTRSSR